MNRKTCLAPQFNKVWIVGVGGTGSYLAQGLAKMVAGYNLQLDVFLVDPDEIEQKNCSRQNFMPWEIGFGKAAVLAYRLNQQYGVGFGHFSEKGESFLLRCNSTTDLIITCVDTVEARKPYKDKAHWLDIGNGIETGQAIYGTTADGKSLRDEARLWDRRPHAGRLPNPYRVANMGKLKSSKAIPSCADTPFAEQGCFVNEWSAQAGLTILHQLLVKGEVTTPAIYFDCSKGRMSPEFITKEYLCGAVKPRK